MGTVLERLTEAQNAHDADRFASLFAADYRSEQPTHPSRAFTGNAQVHTNWTAVFAGIPDFHAELVASCRGGDVEWGEVDWSGNHTDGSSYAMRGVVIATIRDDLIASMRLYIDPVEQDGGDINAQVEELYRPPHGES